MDLAAKRKVALAVGAICVVAVLLQAFSGSKPISPAITPAPEPVLAVATNRDSTALDGDTRRSAVPASPKEWNDIQSFTKAVWGNSLAQGRAHDKVMRAQETALKSADIQFVKKEHVRIQGATPSAP